MVTAIYVRTSTDDNDGEAQKHELLPLVEARWPGQFKEVYLDRGESGAKASRPAWDMLMQNARRGHVRRVVCTELSRLGRKLGHLVLVLDELYALGCEVVIVRQGIDYGTPMGRMVAQIMGAFAEFERECIGERIRSGVKRAQERGTRSGKAIGGQQREFDLARAMELRAIGKSWRTIAQAVGCPTATVRRRVEALKANGERLGGVSRTTTQKEADLA